MNILLTDNEQILLTCVCVDPEPPSHMWKNVPDVEGWSNGWNVVKSFKMPNKYPTWVEDYQFPWDWIFYLSQDKNKSGRSARAGYIDEIASGDRTPERLAAMCAQDSTLQFAVWWQLCKSKTETKDVVDNAKAKKKQQHKKR